jgi:hypothetical protein
VRYLLLVLVLVPVVAAPAGSEVTIDWVTVGDPGNDCDPQSEGCFGSVSYPYRISELAVTNAQYTEFLNAVAAADPNGLYDDVLMSSIPNLGGISRSGDSGSYSYDSIAGRAPASSRS